MGRRDRSRSRSHHHRSNSRSRSRFAFHSRLIGLIYRSPSSRYSGRSSRKHYRSPSPSSSRRYKDSKRYRRDRSPRRESRDVSRSPVRDNVEKGEKKGEKGDLDRDTFPKAVTTESNGEISCSIEETNRIRAELGLPPLELDDEPKEPQNEDEKDEEGYIFVDHKKILEEEHIRQKLEKSRQKREFEEYQNLKGKSLGDLLTDEMATVDVKTWVC